MPDHVLRVYDDVLELLPSPENPTPLVRLDRVVGLEHAKVYAKLEWFNPSGAVKDRVAANLVRDAEASGRLEPGTRLVEATSGNTGMGLAMVASRGGYRLTTTLSTAIPAAKRAALRYAGAEVIELADDLCPAPGQPEGAIALAAELGRKPGALQLDQYSNPANPDAHYRTTGPEIWRQTGGKVTHFFAGLGTCGTITGTGRFLKEQGPVRVVGVHPEEGHDIPGVRSLRQLGQTAFFEPQSYDGLVQIGTDEAWALTERLNAVEGIVAGPSSGMALAGALRWLPDEPGVVAVVVFPDSIWKYSAKLAERNAPAVSPEAALLLEVLALHDRSRDHIDVGTLEDLLDEGVVLVDVRDRAAFDEERLEGSIHLDLNDLVAGAPVEAGRPIVTLCEVGRKSRIATLALKAMGHERVYTLMGGLEAWRAEGLPLDDQPLAAAS